MDLKHDAASFSVSVGRAQAPPALNPAAQSNAPSAAKQALAQKFMRFLL